MAAIKIDLYKQHRDQYKATAKPQILDLPPIPYLAIDGHGSPADEQMTVKMGALYGMAYTLKFMHKEHGQDFVVAKLEGLWHPEGGYEQDIVNPSTMIWDYKLLIRVPEFVKTEDLTDAREQLRKKKKDGPFDEVKLEVIEEGLVVQALHIGPYAEETSTIEGMHSYAAEQGYHHTPSHHEIYLNDPRRVDPAKLKTILRTSIVKS